MVYHFFRHHVIQRAVPSRKCSAAAAAMSVNTPHNRTRVASLSAITVPLPHREYHIKHISHTQQTQTLIHLLSNLKRRWLSSNHGRKRNQNRRHGDRNGNRRHRRPRGYGIVGTASVDQYSHALEGLAHTDSGAPILLFNAMQGETVEYRTDKRLSKMQFGTALKVIENASPHRVPPVCKYFGKCGGCPTMHMEHQEQVRVKNDVLLGQMQRLGKLDLSSEQLLEPIVAGPQYGYRRKARLSLRQDDETEPGLSLGWMPREKMPPKFLRLVDIDHCHATTFEFAAPQMEQTDSSLSMPDGDYANIVHEVKRALSTFRHLDRIPQLELCVGVDAKALVVRSLEDLTDQEHDILHQLAHSTGWWVYVQPGGNDTIYPVERLTDFTEPTEVRQRINDMLSAPNRHVTEMQRHPLYYQVKPDADSDSTVALTFLPLDFIQVNEHVNNKIVQRVMNELKGSDIALDLFCGVGNFSIPMSSIVKQVIGVELDPAMVERASFNAELNEANASFVSADLYSCPDPDMSVEELYDEERKRVRAARKRGIPVADPIVDVLVRKLRSCVSEMTTDSTQQVSLSIMLDPPRSGARHVLASILPALAEHVPQIAIRNIVYVSCNPATLARDATDIDTLGYRIRNVQLADMFPNTSHSEAIAVFDPKE
jgi:23S rRNA (uracil1939-C5)-methyltransferase